MECHLQDQDNIKYITLIASYICRETCLKNFLPWQPLFSWTERSPAARICHMNQASGHRGTPSHAHLPSCCSSGTLRDLKKFRDEENDACNTLSCRGGQYKKKHRTLAILGFFTTREPNVPSQKCSSFLQGHKMAYHSPTGFYAVSLLEAQFPRSFPLQVVKVFFPFNFHFQ